jgi:sugar-specific transcriptional regulator TrmB
MPIFDEKPDIKVKYVPMTSISLEALKEIREKLDAIQGRIDNLEKIIEEKIPDNVLTENSFKQELQTTEEIVDMIVSKLKGVQNDMTTIAKEPVEIEPLEIPDLTEHNITIVEKKKINKIKSLLLQHSQLSSTQLAQLMDMSRTRCNEYFKQMENFGMVEPVLMGKEKFYKLS